MSPLHPSSKTASILKQTLLVWLVLMALEGGAQVSEAKCAFEGIFNFGDSNSDTGGFWAAFPAQSPPFGMTYFKKPVGRATDGRLILDFLGKLFLCISKLENIGIKGSYGNHLLRFNTILDFQDNSALIITVW